MHVQSELRDQVKWITINRPRQCNALTVDVLKQLTENIRTAAADVSVRCLVLTGANGSFSAGADIQEWADAERKGNLETYGWIEQAHELIAILNEFQKPTVAIIDGAAVGAGLDLALACDFRIASRASRFKAGHILMAYSPDTGGSWFLPALIGLQKAKQFIFLAEQWDTSQAFQAGLITKVIDDEALDNVAITFTNKLAQAPTFAIGHSKKLLHSSYRHTLAEQLELEKAAGLDCGHSKDAIEAIKAFREKRPPVFTGQ